MKNALIVGVDPGITTAIAILDSNGDVLDVYSKRDMTRAEVIKHILEFGTTVIISSDVNALPKSVEKIATKLGAISYSPYISLSVHEKRELTKDHYHYLKNDHEVDALSAAIKAWKHNRTLFSRVNEILKKFDRQELLSDVMLKILKEESPNIEVAISEFIKKGNQTIAVEKIPKEEITRRELVEKLQKKLIEKQQLIDSLRNQNILLSKALNEIRKELNKSKENKFKTELTEDYQELKNYIDYIKKLRKIENKGYYPLIEFGKIDGDSLEQINDRTGLDDRVILVNDKENLNLLNDKNIKCLLTLDKLDFEIKNLEFPVVQVDKDMLKNFDDIKAIKIDYIEKRLADAKRLGLIGWLKGYRKRKD